MQPDLLAERDRARRVRQMRRARLQLVLLLAAIIGGTILAFMTASREGSVPAKEPAAPSAKPNLLIDPAPALPVGSQQPARPAIPTSPPRPTPPPPEPDPGKTAVEHPAPPASPEKDAPVTPPSAREVLSGIGIASKSSATLLPKISEARDVMTRLAAATTLAAKKEWIIEKAGLDDRLREYYEARGGVDPVLGEKEADYEETVQGARLLMVRYRCPRAVGGSLLTAFYRDPSGKVRLDWESFVGYSAMSWTQFREQRPSGPRVFRVFASPDDYYNYEFTDAQKFLSVQLRVLDSTEVVNAFCEMPGDLAVDLKTKLASAPKTGDSQRAWLPLIVRIEFPKEAQSDHCVHFRGIIQDDWLNLHPDVTQ